MKAQFIIHLRDLDDGPKSYRFTFDRPWLGQVLSDTDLEVPAEAQKTALGFAEVHAQQAGQEVVLGGQVKAALEAPCARCLAPVLFEVDESWTAVLTPARASRGRGAKGKSRGAAGDDFEEMELSSDDLDRGTYTGDQVELDAFVREQLILGCPMTLHCAQECAIEGVSTGSDDGEGPDSETASPVDPRLAPLLKFKK